MARRPRRSSRLAPTEGTPIEEAPWWALAILWALFTLVFLPALVGLSAGFEVMARWRHLLGGAAAISLLLVVGLRYQRPWRRPRPGDLADERPVFVRFSTWLWTALLFPNVLHGVLVLSHPRQPPSYAATLLIGALVSGIHGAFAMVERRRLRSRGEGPRPR